MFAKLPRLAAFGVTALALSACTAPAPKAAAIASPSFPAAQLAQDCGAKGGWGDAAPPAHIHGRTYYVGTCGITSLLIDSGDGLILLDGGIAEAGPLILANIKALGFDPADIKIILASHDHFDHVAALASVQQFSDAPIWAFAAAVPQLTAGQSHPSDPQHGHLDAYPPLRAEARLVDGKSIRLGDVEITPYATPAYALGSASYRWQSCENGACQTIAYMDSLSTPPAAFRFSAHPDHVKRIRQGFDKAGKISCDILITPHPSASSMMERFSGTQPLAHPQSCARYVADARHKFEQRLLKEQQ